MKAVVLTRYGSADNIQIKDVDRPIPKEKEILINIKASSVTYADVEFRTGKFPFWIKFLMRMIFGIFRPRGNFILGQEISGDVVEVGSEVQTFSVGDAVLGSTTFRLGGHAEYISLPVSNKLALIILKPDNISYEEAATIPLGAPHAKYFLSRANIKEGDKVLINGAGGTIGTYAIQIAKSHGAHVTAVDSTAKLEMMKNLGADEVIDYTIEDLSSKKDRYDVVFDIVGKKTFSTCIKLLENDGTYLSSNPMIDHFIKGFFVKRRSKKKIISGVIKEDIEVLKEVTLRMAAGELQSVIDKVYSLDDITDAHRFVETGQKLGHVVLKIDGE